MKLEIHVMLNAINLIYALFKVNIFPAGEQNSTIYITNAEIIFFVKHFSDDNLKISHASSFVGRYTLAAG